MAQTTTERRFRLGWKRDQVALPDPGLAWHPAQRIAFRFAFTYLVLYLFPFPLGDLPGGDQLYAAYDRLWQGAAVWTGRAVLRLPYEITVFTNGSGDTTYNYVQVLCCVVAAAAAALGWTLLRRTPVRYDRLHAGLRLYVRFALAGAMFAYGAVKVIKTQFPDPALSRLLQPLGEFSPMGLLWTFMGYSEGYTFFAGAVEMVAGVLLVIPRTTLLGALVAAGTMANVFALNMGYDVPVKLYSFHLLGMALFLAAPDARRLADLFVFNRRVEPAPARPLFTRPRAVWGARLLGTAYVLYFIGVYLNQAWETRQAFDLAPRSPLYGIWTVDEMEVDGVARPPLVTDEGRWRRVVFDMGSRLSIHLMNDRRQPYALALDSSRQTLTLTRRDEPAWQAAFTFAQPAADVLALTGTMDGQQVRARLRRTEAPSFPLLERGFHWINEYPYNR